MRKPDNIQVIIYEQDNKICASVCYQSTEVNENAIDTSLPCPEKETFFFSPPPPLLMYLQGCFVFATETPRQHGNKNDL